jgi:hypothetical protein
MQGQQLQGAEDVRTSILDFWGNLDFTTLISMRNERITRLES